MRTADGRELPPCLRAELDRLKRRLALARDLIRELETERASALEDAPQDETGMKIEALSRVRGTGYNFAAVLTREVFYRRFDNRRQLASYVGIAPMPHQSGTMDRDRGIGHAGKELSNPIASLISLPFQLNHDRDYGAEDGYRTYMNVQPVAPFSIGEPWNLISRTILPVIWQHDIAGASGDQSGLGDITQSLFLSPKQSGPGGIIWGAGPVMLIPTATDGALGAERAD